VQALEVSVNETNAEQLQFRKAAIEFAKGNLSAGMIERDRDSHFDRQLWQKCAEFGILGMPIPQNYGGLGLGLSVMIDVMEGLGFGARDHGLLFSLNAHLWTNSIPILEYGTEAQRQKYLPGLCDGTLIGANGASEPGAGSDIFSMRTRATRDGDDYILTGNKLWVTNGPVADIFVTYATVNASLGVTGITAFIIEKDTPGLTIGKHAEKMGLRTSPMSEVNFEKCRVPVSQRLGREGRGAAIFECSMEWERGCILASVLGSMQRQLDECVDHARTRKQFGKAIGKNQSIANKIVDMKMRLETCRPLVQRIGKLKDAGMDATVESSMAKLHVSECYVQSSLDAIQVHGAYGYMREAQIERDLRDAVASRIFSGTSEIQRNIIARGLGL
jgi:alkylation response protein AidB-like acyl-CoA dehydrogenase